MVIGLTGKICSGKNYVGLLLEKRGFAVLDLDVEAARIRKDRSADVFRLFGTTDSKEIAAVVFREPEKLRVLEGIVYPELEKRIMQFDCTQTGSALVINGALLRRAGLDRLCSFAIYVRADDALRRQRALDRGMTNADFTLRNNSQSDVDPALCSYACPVFTLDNDGTNANDAALESRLFRILAQFSESG